MLGTTPGRKAFAVFNNIFLSLVSLSMLIPFLNILAGSLSEGLAILQGKVGIWPVDFTWVNYQIVLGNPSILRSFLVTVIVTSVGTIMNLIFTALMAYGLAKEDLRGRKFLMLFILFTMIFQAPLIPSYLVVKYFGLLNTIWSLIIPGLISAYNLILMITFFRNIPDGLMDSARIDGAGEYRILWSVVLPLSLPSLMTIGLFYAVGHWNSYFAALMYIRNPDLYTLQVKLQQLLLASESFETPSYLGNVTGNSAEGIKMASIIVATVPILLVYPFIQKHFVKGALLGSLKG